MKAPEFAWSFSSLKSFTTCPLRYYEERVKRSVQRKPTEQTLWGEEVHQEMDKAITTGTPPTGRFQPYAAVAERFTHVKGTLYTEQELAITRSLKPTTWFAPDVWCRGILDAVWIDAEVGKICDWKSGKPRKDPTQLKLFALLLFAHQAQIERVNASFVWLQTGAMDVQKYRRQDVPVLWQDILPDVRRLEVAYKTNTWPPRPSGLCNYCPVKTCNFWRGENGEGKQKGRA